MELTATMWRASAMTLLLSLALSGCALLTPLPETQTLQQRLAAMPTEDLPLRDAVTIYWDDHQIPFIQAEHDEDAAFALGMVHAHLISPLTKLDLADSLSI